jgi:hypothetical protein
VGRGFGGCSCNWGREEGAVRVAVGKREGIEGFGGLVAAVGAVRAKEENW